MVTSLSPQPQPLREPPTDQLSVCETTFCALTLRLPLGHSASDSGSVQAACVQTGLLRYLLMQGPMEAYQQGLSSSLKTQCLLLELS